MEVKKNKNVDIHRFSGLFFQIGLVLSLAMVVIAFEWRSSDDGSSVDLGSLQEFEDIIDIPNTIQPPPPPPVIQQPRII
ncbi:MAG: energy transducer TonB, partial [Bacteroidetes bacterium]|nr:energy transducer TonB [Bacteroidota bacterium]